MSLLTFTPPAAVAATKLVHEQGGELGLTKNPEVQFDPLTGIALNYIDRRDDALYDVMRIPAGTRVPEYWPFFSSGIGYNLPGSFQFKTYLDTNMQVGNMLPAPRTHHTQRILFLFSPRMCNEDRDNLAANFYWEFMLCNKVMARSLVARCAVAGEPGAVFDDWGGVRTPRRNNQPISPQFAMHLKHQVTIPTAAYFAFNFRGNSFMAKENMEFYVLLDGVGDFPLQ